MYDALYEKLQAALHSVSFCGNLMDIDPSDRTIADYEKALDYAVGVRAEIGAINEAHLKKLDFLC